MNHKLTSKPKGQSPKTQNINILTPTPYVKPSEALILFLPPPIGSHHGTRCCTASTLSAPQTLHQPFCHFAYRTLNLAVDPRTKRDDTTLGDQHIRIHAIIRLFSFLKSLSLYVLRVCCLSLNSFHSIVQRSERLVSGRKGGRGN